MRSDSGIGVEPGIAAHPDIALTLRLTTRSVAALPVTGKDALYWDRDFTGFGV